MNNDLYFVPILAEALTSSDKAASLEAAFVKIDQLSKRKMYRQGYVQFKHFIAEAFTYHQIWEENSISELVVTLATGLFDDRAMEKQIAFNELRFHPDKYAEYEVVSRQSRPKLEDKLIPVIQIIRNEQVIGEMSFTEKPGRKSVANIDPGHYTIKLTTGLVFWEERLTDQDLTWTKAFDGRYLDMAADTGDVERKPTRKSLLWDGQIVVSIFPGIEAGSIEIEITK